MVQDFFHQQHHKLNQMTTCDDSFECLLECLFVKGMECLCDLSYQLAVPSRSSLSCEGPPIDAGTARQKMKLNEV